MEAQCLSTCNQCGKKFQRKAHLLRHQQQHSGDRPYSCKFCSKTFKRSDVLRDHFSRCDRRGTSAIPNSLERGRKRHACDECSRLKVKCDNTVPCRKCKEFGRTCVKTRSGAASSPEQTTSPSASTPDTPSDRNSIGFLLNCPGETDFMREFPKSTTLSPNNKSAVMSNAMPLANGYEPLGEELQSGVSVFHDYGHMIQENNLDVFLSHLEFQTYHQQTQHFQVPDEDAISWSGLDTLFLDRRVLEQRASEIREKLKYAAATENQPHVPSKELLDAIEWIKADNIVANIELYFRHWHKHAPMVHEGTLNPCTAALPLVLVLMSIGGMYSKDAEDVTKIKILLDTIEQYIYSVPGINDEYDLPGRGYVRQGSDASLEWQQYQFEELLGAYLIITLQYWTGTDIARTRVRQMRFQRLVAIFHHLELVTLQHSPNHVITDQQSFKTWTQTESRLRLVTIATMLDNTFGILNNACPCFQWAEIDLCFPSDNRYFEIESYDTIPEYITEGLHPPLKMKIKDAFLCLFSPPETADEGLKPLRSGNLTPMDMQILILFLYAHIWASTFNSPIVRLPTISITALVAPFKVAMRNWKIIWDEIRSSAPESEWNKLGFQRMAETYYDAVKAIVGVFEKNQGRFPPIPSDCEKGKHLKRLLSY